MGNAMTFREWLDETIENEEADEEYQRDLERYEAGRRQVRRIRMINALATFFPDMPQLEARVYWGVTSY